MDTLEAWIGTAGGQLWTWIVLPVVAGLGLYFTIRSGVVQFRLIPEMFRTLANKTPTDAAGRAQSVSAFQAFTISAASRVGVGNIAGVGTAIAVGGPGAIFWMWTMAFIGGASSFIESTLAQLYKTRDRDAFRGGPAYYIQRGLGARWAGILFAIVLILCFPLAFSSLQANTISATIASTTGSDGAGINWVVGLALAALTALVVFGGVRRIASVTQSVVPVMAVLYLLVGLVIVGMNVQEIPRVFGEIFAGAFGFQEIAGGLIGTIILTGVQRGMFSNEAGLGSSPNAGAAAAVTHPVKQGLVQTLGVYFDTFLVCSITAFIILVTNPDLGSLEEGISTTQDALVSSLGSWSAVLLSVIIFLLAFSSILGNYYYGEANLEFISTNRALLTGFRMLVVLAVLGGSVASTSLIWTTADGIMGVMALINLVAIGLLSRIAIKLLRNYTEQRKRGLDPVFTQDQVPGLKNVEFWQDADTVTGPLRAVKTSRRG
ncbi:alanine:cation symporter family protein [Salinibacterium sp. SYSU T00001]|uniref:alanine/glycine:cation symporter family protein n=1 Tax=Homoserinimonas sedimenticola TaxID=2986805 RepID=UPI002235DADE|nr:alanine/glycine:cation symporter family protein [Salinibacterium sedimenticola]MCW4386707.1 alanine:cation symporter family protein [Salinibacterium sedimenticola]